MAEKTSVADRIPDEDCYTVQMIADEIGLGIQRTRQIIDAALDKRITVNISKKRGAKILYAPQMAQKIIKAYNEGQLGIVRRRDGSKVNKKAAKLLIEVPIYDENIANILTKKFGTEKAMSDYLKDHLEDEAKPVLARLQELEEKAQREREALFSKLK